MNPIDSIKVSQFEYEKFKTLEDAMEFGVFDTSTTLDDFKKKIMVDQLINGNNSYFDGLRNDFCYLQISPGDDKYIICRLLDHIDVLTNQVNILTSTVETMRSSLNFLVSENNRSRTWISQV